MPNVQQGSNHVILRASNLTFNIDEQWFDSNYWKHNNAVIGSSQGRSATYFIETEGKRFALRHYHRGGLIRKLMADRYLFLAINKTRVFNELAILEEMQKWGLPVPSPVAGLIRQSGFVYRADMLMELIPNAANIYERLLKSTLASSIWESMGKTIAQFHSHGVYHADLNCHNLMIDNHNKIWVIDFDRAKLQTANGSQGAWQAQNLGRLYRSFVKEKAKNTRFYFTEKNWEQLLRGYDS